MPGFLYYSWISGKYRNQNARHTYEKETKHNITNVVENDSFIEERKNLSSSKIRNCNNDLVAGVYIGLNKKEEKNNK